MVRDPTGTELATEATDLLMDVVLEATGATETEPDEMAAEDWRWTKLGELDTTAVLAVD